MNYTCPYCGHHSTIVGNDSFNHWRSVYINATKKGAVGVGFFAVRCPNPMCHELYLKTRLTRLVQGEEGPTTQTWQLLPESSAKVLPEYIPVAIKEDYYEACRIRDLSPKASATLARRALQGMIRDFWKVESGMLKNEIEAIKDQVNIDTWDAIDAVRSVGNIGAHMEKDVNVIIEIDPNEAQLLIGLIENLVEDWYVTRYERQQRLENVRAMADQKKKTNKPESSKN